MYINQNLGEIHLKIVYYGPALSGKTTNLEYIHNHTNPQMRSDLVSLKTRGDRTIFFDFLQLELGKISGLTPKFSLYTVPGQAYYAATRKLVLQGADGIVFVADSHARRLSVNLTALQEMRTYLWEAGYDPNLMPLVVQFNKQDLAEAVSERVLHYYLGLNGSIACFPAVAIRGEGVLDTLKASLRQVVNHVQTGIGTQ